MPAHQAPLSTYYKALQMPAINKEVGMYNARAKPSQALLEALEESGFPEDGHSGQEQ